MNTICFNKDNSKEESQKDFVDYRFPLNNFFKQNDTSKLIIN